MPDLLAARLQMAISLGFHIVFAAVGMAMPLFMVLAEWRFLRTGHAVFLDLARRWAKGSAILFAVGAVSGTVLSFELGLLWPRFMERAGPLIGMPFSLEGFAFFLEAIFLGIYLYGWDRVSRLAHFLAGTVVAVSGLASGIFVVAVNAWMNTPSGFVLRNGEFADIDLTRAFLTRAFLPEALHMALAAYASVAFAVLGVHAWCLLRRSQSRFHREAAAIALGVAAITTPLQIASGDYAAKRLAVDQPVKLAAAEAHFRTERAAPIIVGGFADVDRREVYGGVRIPRLLSVLAKGDPNAEVLGLDAAPRDEWPPIVVTHLSFDVMVACGTGMLAFVLWGLVGWIRRRDPFSSRIFLRAATFAAPLGFLAVEAGWVVTEVGRQPWIVVGVLKTRDAVTPVPHLVVPLVVFTALYVILGVIVITLLHTHVVSAPDGKVDEP
jgi:cytochrome bd ubiquinol oxidase subunit I